MSISWPFSRRSTQPDAGAADSSRAHAADRTTAAGAAGPPRAHPAGGTTSAGAAGPADRTTPARDHEPDASRAAISVEGLNVDRGGVRVLHDLSFSVAAGERITITGSNGAGKTTLLSTILGLLSPASGRVRVDGMRVGSRTWRRTRHIVGYVSQHAVHTDFPISAAEVVAIGLSGGAAKGARGTEGVSRGAADGSRESAKGPRGAGGGLSGRREKRRRMHEAMEMAGCAHLAGAAYARLSGGQRQRVSIARCLCQNPRILLLDEPTASLDPEGKETLLSLADSLSQTLGITVLMVSHESSHFERPGWRRLALEAGRIGSDAPDSSPWK